MRNAETILTVIRDRGSRRLPLERVYRLLFNRELFLLAYGRIAKNAGALTPGVTAETADGMSLAKIDRIIDALRAERYRWTPARRVFIPKANGKTRPLGLPTWSDKLVQEVIRLILDAYYEPQFSAHSHGFRPGRGCHTALKEVYINWQATTWLIEGDIAACFDSLDHQVLLDRLAETIHDGRFLRLIGELLKAGYLEDWRFNATLSGTPQGGVVSPILSNIYLDRLDRFVETVLCPAYTRGTERKPNVVYYRTNAKAHRLRRLGRYEAAAVLRKQAKALPSKDPNDPDYRRLRYVRYADDFLLGFIGPRAEAEEIKRRLAEFLCDDLRLELSATKTLITHARSNTARFLGYEVHVLQNDAARGRTGRRNINGVVGLRVPMDVVRTKCRSYMAGGKPIHRMERTRDAVISILDQYQTEYRGVVEYYRMAYNLHQLATLKWVMDTSLTKTLAHKLRISVNQVYRRFGAILQTPDGPYKGLRATHEREGRQPLVGQWGGISLKWRIDAVLNDQPKHVWNTRTDLVQRLLADECELCGSHERVEVHHIRALRDLRQRGRTERPKWMHTMAARRRKTLVVCRACHEDIQYGRPRCLRTGAREADSKTLESRVM